MNKLVIYDSQYGNSEKIAQAIAQSISATCIRVADVRNADLDELNLLVVGSPTHGGRATSALDQFLEQIPAGKLSGVKIAAFDTRLSEKDVNFALRLLMKTIDYAAPKIARLLVSRGGKQISSPQGFIVKGKEGPLVIGELERARLWINQKVF